MATFALTLAMLLQIVSSSELNCVGAIHDTLATADVFIAGTREEGMNALATEGELVYLNGPGLSSLKTGEKYRVVRREGVLQDSETHDAMGYYLKSVGLVRVDRVDGNSALATVLTSCEAMVKGDLVIPATARLAVEYKGELSNRLTAFPADGLTSVIILGENDVRELATGQFCYIKAGTKDGVKAGDRFTVFRLPPPYQIQELEVLGKGPLQSYRRVDVAKVDPGLVGMLRERRIPPRPIGDLVVIEAGDVASTARVVNSMAEIHPGDIIVKR
jgi:hypothetical protein